MSDLAPKVSVAGVAARIAAKTALGQIPGVGPLLCAVIDEVLPAVRAHRLEGFAAALNTRVRDIPTDILQQRFSDPDRLPLMEDGLWAASRASTTERIEQIAAIVANGLTNEEARAEDRRHLLQLLGELNDVEVLVLCSHAYTSMVAARVFLEGHKDALGYKRACIGDGRDVIERQAVRENYEDHLLRLGLLEDTYIAPHNKPIEFDRHGRPAGMRKQLSDLGRYLLREIGQAPQRA